MDRLCRLIQQVKERADRAIVQRADITTTEIVMPAPESDKVLGWNEAGTSLENKVPVDADVVTAAQEALEQAEEAQAAAVAAQVAAEEARDAAEAIAGWEVASQAEAEAGTDNTKVMTPLRVKQSVESSWSGKIEQIVYEIESEAITVNSNIPTDNTIPQITEGVEIVTKAITPKSATNLLKIDVVVQLWLQGVNTIGAVALFQDTTANALSAAMGTAGATGSQLSPSTSCSFTHYMVAGTTSETTFKVRAGASATSYVNANGGTRCFGGVSATSITITEIAA